MTAAIPIERARRANGSPPPRDEPPAQPLISIRVGRPYEAIQLAIEALRADPDLYVRDTDLAHVTRVTREEQEESEGALVAGTPKIHPMTLPTLRVRMCRVAEWERTKVTKEGLEQIACEPTRAMAEELRDEKHWPGIRPLVGVSETPFPRPDLTICQGEAHYDRATGYLYEPNERYQAVPDRPTREDAIRSREALEDLFVDFPFSNPAGASAAVAATMTLICRPAIRGPVPAWIIDATSPGTGKTTMADAISAVALGRDAGRAHFPASDGRNGDEELGKRLGMFARMGLPLVCFDNADEAIIGGDVMEEVVSTPTTYTFRILGKSEGLTLPVRMVFICTANNATWSRGMTRRILHVRLESALENPEHRPLDTYVHPDRAGRLYEFALEHRAEYVRHALTIVRAYACAGRPDPLTLGTFEAWARLIPSAIVWAGGLDPMLCRPSQSGEESPDTLQRQTLAREWAAFCRQGTIVGISAHELVERLYPQLERGQSHDPGWDSLRGAIEFFVPPRPGQSPDPAKLGVVLGKRFKGAAIRTHDAPASLRRFAIDGKSGGRARWKVEDIASGPVYAPAPPPEEPAEAPLPPIAECRAACPCGGCARCGGCVEVDGTGRATDPAIGGCDCRAG